MLLPGQRHDMIGVEALIEGVYFDALLADKAFDADWLRVELDERGASAVIPPKANRKQQLEHFRIILTHSRQRQRSFCTLVA